MNLKPKLFFVFFLISFLVFSLVYASAASQKLSSELKQKVELASSSDSLDVIVVLKEPTGKFSTQGEKSSSLKISQDNVISAENINPKIKRKYSLVNSFSASLTKDEIEKLEKNNDVERIYYPKSFSIALQDSVSLINANDVWSKQIDSANITGSGQTICVLDTGINASHPALSGRVVAQHCYESLAPYCPNGQTEDTSAADDHGHGTHVAGIAAASGGINGVARGANIAAIKIMNSAGAGNSTDLISGLEWCVNNADTYNISAISMSLGTWNTTYSDYCDSLETNVANMINQAIAKNITVLIASGNDGRSTSVEWPACIENATSVGGINKDNSFYTTSNRWNKTNMVLAPGVNINSTSRTGGYVLMSGTSMATPHVAGAVALLQQYSRLKNNRQLTPREIFNALKNTGVNVSDPVNNFNFSRIDVLAALKSLSFYRIIDNSIENSLMQTNESMYLNFTNLNVSADFLAEKISNKNLWIISSNLSAGSFNATIKFFYDSFFLRNALFINYAIMTWTNSTSSGNINATLNITESSATINTDHFTDFSISSGITVNGTNIAPVATNCNTSIGIISINISDAVQDDNITQIIVSSKNSNDSEVLSVLLCSDDGNPSFNIAADCNSTLKINETNFTNLNATFSNIISITNNTNKILHIAYNISSCQNNNIFDAFIPDAGITMQLGGISIGSIDPAGNATADSSAPYYTSINISNYTYSASYLFYSTWLDNSQVDTAWLEINQSGNFTASSQGSNIFMVNATNLAAGNYTYRWWANDSLNNINQSSWIYFVISKANSSINLTINGTDSDLIIEINNMANKTASLLIPGSGYIELYENNTLIANGTSTISNTSNYNYTGSFNITAFYPETQNYSSSSHTHFITVQETTIPPSSYKISPPNNNYTSNRTQIFSINATDASLKNATLYIFSSGSAIYTNTTSLSGISASINWTYNFSSDGTYTWSARVYDNSNNSNWSDGNNWTLTIDTLKPVINLSLSSSSITTSQTATVQCNVTESNLNSILINISGSTTTCASSPCTYTNYAPSSAGTKTVNCSASDKAGNSNSTTATLTVTQAQTSTNSGSPSGGAPATTQPTPIPSLPQITQSKTISVILANTSSSIPINKETTFTNMEIYAKNTISNSELTIKKVSTKPSEVTIPSNQVYSYIEISTDMNDEDIANVTITFEVGKSWLNNVNLNSTVLQRYHDGWQSLSTQYINESETSFVYKAVSPGLSVFAITANKLEIGILGSCGDGRCTGNETKINCCKDCGCEGNQTCMDNKCTGGTSDIFSILKWFLGAILLAIIIRIAALILPKIKEKLASHKKHKKFHPHK